MARNGLSAQLIAAHVPLHRVSHRSELADRLPRINLRTGEPVRYMNMATWGNLRAGGVGDPWDAGATYCSYEFHMNPL